jgi:hypothetical protein
MAKNRSIRVNLRFGARTDPDLVAELIGLSPQERARWVRTWLIEGWRVRSRGLPRLRNTSSEPNANPVGDSDTPAEVRHTLGASVEEGTSPEQALLNLISKAVQ